MLPGSPSALEGQQSTQAKCSSSAALHLGRKRNANEFCGAFGHQLTFDEVKWLADWLLVRGVNLLLPHAFYYPLRGPRVHERPPDVGPHSPWWEGFRAFADYAARLCGMNAEGLHVCEVAVLGLADELPWRAARALFEGQVDFNYLEARHLWEDAEVDAGGVRLAGMRYRAVVLDGGRPAGGSDVDLVAVRKASSNGFGALLDALGVPAPLGLHARAFLSKGNTSPGSEGLDTVERTQSPTLSRDSRTFSS